MTSMAGRARRSLLAAVLLAGLAVSCASGSEGTSDDEAADDTTGSTTPTTVADAPLAGAEAVAAAEERLQPWIEGTMRPPPDDGPPATDGAEIYVVSCGQLLESCTILVDGVMEAAGEAGWDATLVDTALDFSAAGGAIRQAMAAGADGAIVVGVDCQHFAGALDEANAADFPVVVLNAFDCDVTSDGAEPARFSAQVDFTEGDEDPVDNARRFAAAKVDWGVIETDADLQVINMVQDDLLASQLLGEGFAEGVTTCSSCSVVDTITFSTSDLLDGTFPQKIAQSIVEHPEANAIHFPYAATISLGIAGLQDAGGDDLLVIGGEGSPSQYELLANGTVDMLMAFDTAWTGWAAVDTLNRIFNDVETVDEGVGYQLVTAEDMEGLDDYEGPYDYRAVYREVWGA
jgi:ribose transport system substrate-binding protein